jgi:hypothetical protein
METGSDITPSGNHAMCCNNFLLVTRSATGRPFCVASAISNLTQNPNALPPHTIKLFGARGVDRQVGSLNRDFVMQTLPSMEAALVLLRDVGFISGSGDHPFTELYINGSTRADFINANPTHFLVSFNIVLPGSSPDAHFEAVVCKFGVYWLLTGISSGKVIKLGDMGATANVLFSTNGRAALFDHLRTEYKRGSDENLELDWGSNVVPFIVVPTMRMPTGRSSSIWDTFGDKEEIRESIGSCVTFRNDRRVMSQHPMSAQIINLNDPLDVANHTVVLEM